MMKALNAATICLLLAGCSLAPDYNRPAVDVPQTWRGAESSATITVPEQWWKEFGSAELDALMERAIAQNNDLRAAIQRVEQARGQMKIAGAPLYPAISGTAGAGWDRNNSATGKTTSETSWNAGAGVSYELDLFGLSRSEADAARASYEGTVFDREAAALIVKADVAQAYFAVLDLRERRKIAEENLDNAQSVLKIVNAQFEAGTTSALEVSQQKTALAATEAALAATEQQLAAAENALSVLLGAAPGSVPFEAKSLDKIAIPSIAAGQPSALLERRPDVRRAEMDLVAANADIGAARAAFFPQINLGLDWGIAGSPVGGPTATALGLASALTAPIFSGGRNEGGLIVAKARHLELVEDYKKTALTSFQETEDAIALIKASQNRLTAFETALRESQKAYNLSRQQYDAGAIDFQTLLDTQRSLFSARDSLAAAKRAVLSAMVDLYKALGGGWDMNGR